ncbi:MAG TPA: ABC transporter ATP-binding protein [Actinomycetota bacterium]
MVANDGVDLVVGDGEIHALLGENGAGKTTLMNVVYGLYHSDGGRILLDGKEVRFASPKDAIAAGIGMVHQHFMLVPVFTVAENVMLGIERAGPLGVLDRARARRDVRELSERYGLSVTPDAQVEDLPVGVQQRVEILKALVRQVRILILDEPTAVLTPQEIEEFFRVIRTLRDDSGTSIIFITHKLKEVLEIADRVTVMRHGRVVGSTEPSATTEQQLASMMVGREVQLRVSKGPAHPGEPVLRVESLTVADDRDQVAVDGVSFEVRAGEILMVAGVQGNGQTELVEALTGLRRPVSGAVTVAGRDLTGASPRDVLRAGVAHVPEDRQKDGMIPTFPIQDNLVLDTYDRDPYARGWSIDREQVHRSAVERMREFDIRAPSVVTPAATLSGGNQQKVIVAREFSRPISLLIASQPTRGLDVGSVQYIHERIVQQRDEGVAVLIVSSELDEVTALADRIAVMFRGGIAGPFDAAEMSRERLGLLMAGVGDAGPSAGDAEGSAT